MIGVKSAQNRLLEQVCTSRKV